MPSYDDLKSLQAELIRKSLGGSMFLAPMTADPVPAEPFTYTPYSVGPPVVEESLEFEATAFTGYEDLGYLTDDGISHEVESTESEVTSWQSVTPTRADLTAKNQTITIVAQETKLLTIGLYTGAQLTADSRNATTGTLSFGEPERPVARFWRGCAVFIDGEGADEFIIGRIYPRLKVTGANAQSWGKGDDPISYGVTMRAFMDSTYGTSCRYFFGGLGWRGKLVEMGFTAIV